MEDKTMKKIVLTIILLTCTITGILHSDYRKYEGIENILADQTYLMPEVIINPLIDPITY
jgi:hypothetical protein